MLHSKKNGYNAYLLNEYPLELIERLYKGSTTEDEIENFKKARDMYIDSWKALQLSKIRVIIYLVCSSILVVFVVFLPKRIHEPYIENRNEEENYER